MEYTSMAVNWNVSYLSYIEKDWVVKSMRILLITKSRKYRDKMKLLMSTRFMKFYWSNYFLFLANFK